MKRTIGRLLMLLAAALMLTAAAAGETDPAGERTTWAAVKAVWEDSLNQDGIRPLNLTVFLLADGERIASVRLSRTNSWTALIRDLPAEKDGQEILYTWEEASVDGMGYTFLGTGQAGSITLMRNGHTAQTLEIRAKAQWPEQEEDPEAKEKTETAEDPETAAGEPEAEKPGEERAEEETVTVQLFADGVACGEPVTFRRQHPGTARWPELPKYVNIHHLSGKQHEILYTLEVLEAPEGYEAAVRKMTKRGFLVEIQETGAAGEKEIEVRNLEEKKDQKTETGTEIAGRKENGAAEGEETEVR